ncbi:TRAM, LAG1 and CLN8 (TLC) lipid-sensing domain containing protein [Actinidia rufa]|uniref:TRAM, LAG1 and CLN8 (TLC) lipid-sensing domain containing protein n=1 Tax=Actinidia rufa TaxID=165716 RepID=A0A7J0FAK5_9ERIC|nr:TRAM, LAG1 and CLN8 (TLC) lipid-sensing domain containing protein [Actinidia rufa]
MAIRHGKDLIPRILGGLGDLRLELNDSFEIVHHSLSAIAVAYAMFTGEGQLYTFMVLISEVTTPEINMRWYLDTAGLKRSNAYLINGVVIFFAWLVIQMHIIGFLLVFVVPSALATMNLIWFGKIVKGLKKTLAKRP